MKRSNRILKLTLAFLSVLLISAVEANAQSTIITMPSTDILSKRTIGIRFGSKFKVNDQPAKKRFSSFIPRFIIGVSKDVEIGLNIPGNIQPGKDTTTLIPSVKWRVYQNEKASVAIVTGNNLYIPVHNKKFNLGTYAYFQGSKVFNKTKTRVTIGSYLYTKNIVASNANRAGGQFAVEQTVTKNIALAAEWTTGKHSAGYFTPGVKMKFHKQVSGVVAYQIGNNKAAVGNHFFYAALAVNFSY